MQHVAEGKLHFAAAAFPSQRDYRLFMTIRRTGLKDVVSVAAAISVFNTCTRCIVLLDAGMVKRARP